MLEYSRKYWTNQDLLSFQLSTICVHTVVPEHEGQKIVPALKRNQFQHTQVMNTVKQSSPLGFTVVFHVARPQYCR